MCRAVSKKRHTLLSLLIFSDHGVHTLHNNVISLGQGKKIPLTMEGWGVHGR